MLSCYECKDRAKYGETQEPPSIFRLNKSIRKLKSAVEKASMQYLKVGILKFIIYLCIVIHELKGLELVQKHYEIIN